MFRKRIPAIVAIAHAMRIDNCDRATAMRQIEGAVVDGALLWVRGGSNRWDWDAEVFRADLLKVWPKHAADASLPRLFGDETAPTEPHMLRKQLEDAVNWHNQPIPERTELRRLTEAVAELREAVRAAVRMRQLRDVPADGGGGKMPSGHRGC